MAARPYSATERAAVKTELLARCQAGESLRAVLTSPHMPSDDTLRAWMKTDTAFAEALAVARRIGADRRTWAFDEARAKLLLARRRAGERIVDILADPTMPTWKVYRRWRATQAEFAQEIERLNDLAAAARTERVRRKPCLWELRLADRVVARVAAGTPLPQVLRADPDLPGRRTLARWRAEQPEFDWALRTAMLVAHRRRRFESVDASPELVEAIADGVARGLSLASLSRRPGMPHRETLYRWMKRRSDFAEQVEAARDGRADSYMDQMLDIANAATPATAPAARRRIAALKRRLERLDAKRDEGWERER